VKHDPGPCPVDDCPHTTCVAPTAIVEPPAPTYAETVVADGAAHYWRLNEATGADEIAHHYALATTPARRPRRPRRQVIGTTPGAITTATYRRRPAPEVTR
jgi:hypothetical protein